MSNNGITVMATGAASGPPDRAVLTLGASAIRGEVATALAAVNGKIEKLIHALAGYGIHGADIQTSDLSIWPEHGTEGAVAGFPGEEHGEKHHHRHGHLGGTRRRRRLRLGRSRRDSRPHLRFLRPVPARGPSAGSSLVTCPRQSHAARDLAGTRLGHAVEVLETSSLEQGSMYAMDLATPKGVPVETGGAGVEIHLKVRFAQFPDDKNSG